MSSNEELLRCTEISTLLPMNEAKKKWHFHILISQQIFQLEKLSKEDCHLGALSKQFKNNCKILLREQFVLLNITKNLLKEDWWSFYSTFHRFGFESLNFNCLNPICSENDYMISEIKQQAGVVYSV